MALFVPPIVKASGISVATYDFVDALIAKTLTKKISSNLATIKCDRTHKKYVGDHVYINGLSTHLEYNGYFVISAVSADGLSFSYALTHADDTENSDLGGDIHDPMLRKPNGFYLRVGGNGNIRYALIGNEKAQIVRRKVDTNVATITTRVPHSFKVGNTILIQGLGGTGYNNVGFTITAIPTPKTLTFALTHGDEDVTDSGGIVEDTIVKAFTAGTTFTDPELVGKVFKTDTTATSLVVGYSPYR